MEKFSPCPLRGRGWPSANMSPVPFPLFFFFWVSVSLFVDFHHRTLQFLIFFFFVGGLFYFFIMLIFGKRIICLSCSFIQNVHLGSAICIIHAFWGVPGGGQIFCFTFPLLRYFFFWGGPRSLTYICGRETLFYVYVTRATHSAVCVCGKRKGRKLSFIFFPPRFYFSVSLFVIPLLSEGEVHSKRFSRVE